MASDKFQTLAARLRQAYHRGTVAPLRDGLDPADVEGAYAVQSLNTQHWLESGRRIIGKKIGLTSEAVQKQLGVNQPDFGVLFSDMEVSDGGKLDPRKVLQPKAEAEIALVLGQDVKSLDADAGEIAAAVDYVVPAIEIVDSRIEDWKITFADTVADNGSSAFFVLGKQRTRLGDLDLRTCGMILEVNGVLASMGVGAACLGSPLNAAAWLASTLAARGEPLRAGDLVLTGALGPMVTLAPGDAVRVSIGGVGDCGFQYGVAA